MKIVPILVPGGGVIACIVTSGTGWAQSANPDRVFQTAPFAG